MFAGEIVRTLRLEPHRESSLVKMIALGGYDGPTQQVVELFSKDEVCFTEAEDIDLVVFGKRSSFEEVLIWKNAWQNEYEFIKPKHLYALATQYRHEIFPAPILCLGSVRDNHVLYFNNDTAWRFLVPSPISGDWDKRCLFGFVKKPI